MAEAIYGPNAAVEKGYFQLSHDNHEVLEGGVIRMRNLQLFVLNQKSPWSHRTYAAGQRGLQAFYGWCKEGREQNIWFAEFEHPDRKREGLEDACHEDWAQRTTTLNHARAAARFVNTRMMFELNDEVLVPGPWIVADVIIEPYLECGQEFIDYLREGGEFRFGLRSITDGGHGFNGHHDVQKVITFDIITRRKDDADEAERLELDRRQAEERANNPPADEAMETAPAELHPKTQAIMRRALPAGYDDKLLEKRDSE